MLLLYTHNPKLNRSTVTVARILANGHGYESVVLRHYKFYNTSLFVD